MWQRAQTANQKLKQNVQTQDADGMQVIPVLYMTPLEAVLQKSTFQGRVRGGGGGLRVLCRFSRGSGYATYNTLKLKSFDNSCRSHHVIFFSNFTLCLLKTVNSFWPSFC